MLVLTALAWAAPLPAAQTASPPAFAIETADRAVVLITATYRAGGRAARGSGSGIIIDPSGVILTAGHVVDRASSLEVQLHSGEVLPADVVGTDRVYDIALLRVDAVRPLPAVTLAASSLLQRGDTVVALGRAPRRQAGPTAGTFLEVLPHSPSSLAGRRGGRANSTADFPTGGDVITTIDGRPVTTFGALAAYILSKHIGDPVTLEINRDGHAATITVILGERPTL